MPGVCLISGFISYLESTAAVPASRPAAAPPSASSDKGSRQVTTRRWSGGGVARAWAAPGKAKKKRDGVPAAGGKVAKKPRTANMIPRKEAEEDDLAELIKKVRAHLEPQMGEESASAFDGFFESILRFAVPAPSSDSTVNPKKRKTLQASSHDEEDAGSEEIPEDAVEAARQKLRKLDEQRTFCAQAYEAQRCIVYLMENERSAFALEEVEEDDE